MAEATKTNRVSEVSEALQILRAAGADDIYAEHDTISVIGKQVKPSDAQLKRLEELGWTADDDGGWSCFV